jgi:hypothetical protein
MTRAGKTGEPRCCPLEEKELKKRRKGGGWGVSISNTVLILFGLNAMFILFCLGEISVYKTKSNGVDCGYSPLFPVRR